MTVLKGDRRFRAQGPVFAVALLVLVIAGGTVGYMITDGRGPWAAFYMTVLALTTVESPPHLSRAGQAFTVVLLLVIVITNVPLRGGWSFAIIVFAILIAIILSLTRSWESILENLHLLDIRINLGGYLFISSILFALWLITILVFDRRIYMTFSPGQFKVNSEIGGGEKVYPAEGMALEKQRSDLFRHWILGLGSGDLTVKTTGAQAHSFDLHNVLFIGTKVKQIEEMRKTKRVQVLK